MSEKVRVRDNGNGEKYFEVYTLPEVDDRVKYFIEKLENFYDNVAQEKGYDNRLTCSLRAGYTGPFQQEGIVFAQWMDNCNAYAYNIMKEIQLGNMNMITVEELLIGLPTINW